ncbi:hypothetical protein E3A20_12940 [Planctomyces bekefii]|uniref:arsenite-transporting ATPase n=1 Tax=Planctomyces bekefii TaxID=1653850 RepID=A0A5C6M5Y5_9PLAN|nr:hypothetical protein E3A20_12940 [Planctomyces bekefii]
MTEQLLPWLKGRRTVILLGAGGVGKTTSSIVLALLAAKQGRKVGLLSIDPAKRLAAALGIPLSSQLRRLNLPAELQITGTVDAAMLDQKAVFDTLVRRHAPSDQAAEKILNDKIYKAVSGNLSGPLEYLALAKLQELSEDSRYDFVILDTPPDTHALDFLARPGLLHGFVENRVMTWMIKPFLYAGKLGFAKFLSAGEKLMGGVAKLTGVDALRSFAEFLVLMQEVIEGLNESGNRMKRLLTRQDTGFVLVTIPTRSAGRSAVNIAKQLVAMGHRAHFAIVNKCLPEELVKALKADEEATPLSGVTVLKARAKGEHDVIRDLYNAIQAGVIRVKEQDQDLGTLSGLMELAGDLEAATVDLYSGDA